MELRPGGGSGGAKEDDSGAEAFTASIRRGITQLSFAHVPRLAETLRMVGRPMVPIGEAQVDVSTLVLVTTAELWLFRRDLDLKEIEAASTLEEIAAPVSAVEYETVLSRELRAHQDEWLSAIERTAPFLTADEKRKQVWRQTRSCVEALCPSVYVVNHLSLESTIKTLQTALRDKLRRLGEDYAKREGLTFM